MAGEPAIAHVLVPHIDAGARDKRPLRGEQVADVVQQGGDHDRVGRIGTFGQRRCLQRVLQLRDRLAEIRFGAAVVKHGQDAIGQGDSF